MHKSRETGNEIIAKFMDLSRQDASNGGKIYLYEDPITGEYVYPANLPYMRDWNAIIPVVVEIRDNVPNAMYNDYFWGEEPKEDFLIFTEFSIGKLWDMVVEFCEWYLEHRYDTKY